MFNDGFQHATKIQYSVKLFNISIFLTTFNEMKMQINSTTI